MTSLAERHCGPCRQDTPRISDQQASELLRQLPGWAMHEARSLRRSYAFDSARAARDFFNAVAALAETEGHHPNVHWHGRNRGRELSLELTTYVVHGLTENDFVLAAKIDALTPKAASTPTASATNP